MRRIFALLVVGGLIGAVAWAGPAATAARFPAPAVARAGRAAAWNPDLTRLYDSIGSAGNYSVLSQDFTDSGFDIYDSQLADDFSVPSNLTKGWKVHGIRAIGIFFNGQGPCDWETLTMYEDAAGLPGSVVASRAGRGILSPGGSYTLYGSKPILLSKGQTYWASMVCTMEYAAGGEWGWSTRTVQNLNTAKWQNPGGGFGVCPTWGDMDTCVGISGEPDLQFALVGAAV